MLQAAASPAADQFLRLPVECSRSARVESPAIERPLIKAGFLGALGPRVDGCWRFAGRSGAVAQFESIDNSRLRSVGHG